MLNIITRYDINHSTLLCCDCYDYKYFCLEHICYLMLYFLLDKNVELFVDK